MATGFEPLAIGAAFGGLSGALTAGQLSLSREQYGLDRAAIEANREQAKLDAAEKALSNARGFRKALASQLALANFRGGPGSSIASQFGAESMASFREDQQSLERGMRQVDTAASQQLSGAKTQRFGRDLSTIGGFAQTLLGSTNLSR